MFGVSEERFKELLKDSIKNLAKKEGLNSINNKLQSFKKNPVNPSDTHSDKQ